MAAFLMTACATTVPGAGSDPRDPYENYNRSMFTFNKSVDDNVLKPVATGYVKVVPDRVREAIGNFFANIGDVWTAENRKAENKTVQKIRKLNIKSPRLWVEKAADLYDLKTR